MKAIFKLVNLFWIFFLYNMIFLQTQRSWTRSNWSPCRRPAHLRIWCIRARPSTWPPRPPCSTSESRSRHASPKRSYACSWTPSQISSRPTRTCSRSSTHCPRRSTCPVITTSRDTCVSIIGRNWTICFSFGTWNVSTLIFQSRYEL